MSSTEARLAALEATVNALQRELAEARRPQMRSMRATGRCPACNGRRLLHVRQVKDMGQGKVYSMSLQKDHSAWWGLQHEAGALEVFACRGCRMVEWHAVTLDDIKPNGEDVVEIEGPADDDLPADGTPYR